ncbi:MAG: zf-HC2 domain-containing protein [Streptomyces sp.]|nr:zf-HC2 domain-containing protein [Streptomyces sp.]
MTSAKGTDAHPEVEEISALSEGLLPPERDTEVREHLAGCGLCADVLVSLEEIRGLLGNLPGPHRMPEDVAGRIDAALAAEAHLAAASRVDVPRGTPTDRGTGGGVPRGTSTAPAGRADAPTGPGRGEAPPAGPGRNAVASRRPAGFRRRGRALIASVSAVAALALGGIVYAAVGSGGGASDSSAVSSAGASVSTQVGSQVRQLLGERTPGQADSPMHSNRTNSDTPFSPDNAPAVPSCVLKATHRTQQPLAAEREPFQGKNAYLVVLSHPGDSSKVDAFVVNASCSTTSPGTVLFQATYAR